jgi:hypothetical protein
MPTCSAFTAKGTQCTRPPGATGLCQTHLKCRTSYGPHRYELMQLDYVHANEFAIAEREYQEFVASVDDVPVEVDKIRQIQTFANEYNIKVANMHTRHAQKRGEVEAAHAAFIAEHGFDPDADAKERRRLVEAENRARRNARRGVIRHIVLPDWGDVEVVDDLPPVGGGGPPAGGELREFAADPQNVHTRLAVDNVKRIIANVRTIPVPAEYKWDKRICSKTPGEIIAECRLTQSAAWQMMSQYAQDTAIYDIEEGIYGKVLDSVWQFIKTHAEKDSLIAILRTELEDNIGMCAQGNLTRICNILAGYLDGVGSLESLSERLGRLIPPLLEIDNRDERHVRVLDVLRDNAVPADQWDSWIDAAMA